MEVVKSHGCICLTGPVVERIAATGLSFVRNLHTLTGRSVPLLGTPGGNAPCTLSGTGFLPSCSGPTTPPGNCQQTTLELDNLLAEFSPHVTLVSKEEVAAYPGRRTDLLQDFQLLDSSAFFPVGVAVADTAGGQQASAADLVEAVMGAAMNGPIGRSRCVRQVELCLTGVIYGLLTSYVHACLSQPDLM